MVPSHEIRSARLRAGLSQRALAERAGTSQATIAAYEAGRKQPGLATFARLVAACGGRVEVRPAPRSRGELEISGRHLAEVLALAEALPYRPQRELRYPRLG